MYGEHHPAPETVRQLPVVVFERESRFYQIGFVISVADGRLSESVAVIEAISQLKFTDDVFTKAPFPEIGHGDGFAVDVVVQVVGKILLRVFIYKEHAFAVIADGFFFIR
ncbi:hypothetical protein SDC9_74633 [bioreactor metagenome]|uniref:Uncharacterized protein n=1 Tax=bioreactor metagenome TaxID=1076179 RepID=A0A644YPT6_9ZZZZ